MISVTTSWTHRVQLPHEAVELALSLYEGDVDFHEYVEHVLLYVNKLCICHVTLGGMTHLRLLMGSIVKGGAHEENLAQWLLRFYQQPDKPYVPSSY